jgi:ribosomal protein L11 methyltransferase
MIENTDTPFWYEAVFTVAARHVERAEALLYKFGALSVTLRDAADQPLLEPKPGEAPLWDFSVITALFSQHENPDVLLRSLRIACAEIAAGVCIARVENRPWERVWMEDCRPMHFGRRLSVYPGHIAPEDTGRVNIVLDPGLAFGTGTHPTTALCLRWLDAQVLSGKTCVDYGCGSGILAVSARRLGARVVHAVDIDTQALIATEQNAQRNGIVSRLHAMTPDGLGPIEADIVLANILSNTIVQLAETLGALVKPGGSLVLSGILREQSEEVRNAFIDAFDFEPEIEAEGWILLVGAKKESIRRAGSTGSG